MKRILYAFLPTLLFFLIIAALTAALQGYPIYGPVTSRGQPLIPHYSSVIFYVYLAFLAAAPVASFLLLYKASAGWPKVFAGTGLVLLIPVQAAFVLLMQFGLFGK